jgi:hypothetical protein
LKLNDVPLLPLHLKARDRETLEDLRDERARIRDSDKRIPSESESSPLKISEL